MKPEGSVVDYSYLGDSGLRVANICFGTSTFGDQSHMVGRPATDDGEAFGLLDKYAELGGNYIDTANKYSHGGSETIIGNWLQGKCRDDFIIASKAGLPMDKSNPNALGGSRRHLVDSLSSSLERLNTHFIDTYLLHIFDFETPLEQSLRTLNDFVRSGKVHYIGVSNFKGWQLQKAVDICKYMGLEKVANIQTQYSLLVRSAEMEVVDVCERENVGLTPWCPLNGGWLTGKVTKDAQSAPEGSRIAWAAPRSQITCKSMSEYEQNDTVWKTLEAVEDIAKQKGKTMAQVSLRWLLQKDVVPSVVVGAKTVKQLEDNMGAASGWTLSHDEMKRLDEASSLPWPKIYSYSNRLDSYRK